MTRLKIYLETTLFNYYFDEDRDAHADTVKLFKEIAAGKHEAFTSRYTVDELTKAPEPKRDKMLNLISEYGITILEPDPKAENLADMYIAEGIIPKNYRDDGLHIAIATVNNLNMIVSLNFKHIVRRKTILATGKINVLNGYHAIELNSPMEVVEDENT